MNWHLRASHQKDGGASRERWDCRRQVPSRALHVSCFADDFRALEKFPQIAVRPVMQSEPFTIGSF